MNMSEDCIHTRAKNGISKADKKRNGCCLAVVG